MSVFRLGDTRWLLTRKKTKVIKKRLGNMKERKKKNPNMARTGPRKKVPSANSHNVDASHSASKANNDASPSSMGEHVLAVPSPPSTDEHVAAEHVAAEHVVAEHLTAVLSPP